MFEGILQSAKQLAQTPAIKAIIAFLGVILLGPDASPMILFVITLLLVLDTISGIIKAVYLEEFTAKDLREGVFYKAITYTVTLLCANAVAIPSVLLAWLPQAVFLWIAVTEFASISENVNVFSPVKIPTLTQLMDLLKGFKKSKSDD